MGKRCQVRTRTADQILAENLARIPHMSEGERAQRRKHLKANLRHAQRSLTWSLSGGVARKYQRRGLASAADMQRGFETERRVINEELKALS